MSEKTLKDVLKFWLGEDEHSWHSETYIHKPQLWFKLNKNTDEQISELFVDLLNKAANNNVLDNANDVRDRVALVILFDQMARCIYRGSSDMFKNDARARQIALDLIAQPCERIEQTLSPIERYFVYMPLLHAEDLDLAKQSLDAIEKLANEAGTLQKPHFLKYLQSARVHFDLLLKFGRYPHHNLVLGRESTSDEMEFLRKSKHSFVRSVLPLKSRPVETSSTSSVQDKETKPKQKSKPNTTTAPYQRLLFLHGFRQNANKVRKRLGGLLAKLKNVCNAQVIFLNGTHPYRPNSGSSEQLASASSESPVIMPIESQRAWYNSDDDGRFYTGIDESIAYVLTHIRINGPYDGVIGFSQGAVLASILISKQPSLFSYFISISGFQARSLEHNGLFSDSNPLDFPTLHIYGKRDNLVLPSRSEWFAKCFSNSQTIVHSGGHFAPNSWPNERIAEFIRHQGENLKTPKCFLPNQPLGVAARKLQEAIARYDLNKLDLDPLMNSQEGKEFLKSNKAFVEYFDHSVDESVRSISDDVVKLELNDRLIVLHLLLIRARAKEASVDSTKEYTYSVLGLFLQILLNDGSKRDFFLDTIVPRMFVDVGYWKELVLMCDLCFTTAKQLDSSGDREKENCMMVIYKKLIEVFVEQLMRDLAKVDRKNRTCLVSMLTSLKIQESEREHRNDDEGDEHERKEVTVSALAKAMPRIKSHIDKSSRIAHECADLLNPYTHIDQTQQADAYKIQKVLAFNHYRKVLTIICAFADNQTKEHEWTAHNVSFTMAKFKRQAMQYLMQAPLSQAIINPVPEPVDISSREQMQPLYEWLTQNLLTDADLRFDRGTVTSDGRLDLCKQVIGPQGIKPLLDAMQNSKQVNRLLLGNNIVGDEAGKHIGEFIRSGKSPLKIWYIAGNNLTAEGIKPICEALKDDKQVVALWLKRNPLKAAGMRPIGELLSFNRTIQVLDLLNCGLLDEGVRVLFKSLDVDNSLKHLYLSANGITPAGLEPIVEFYAAGKSHLETLFLGCNRIENRGAEMLAQILKTDTQLVRFNLASSRVGAEGMRAIAEALRTHPTLMVLDMGYTRSTMDLGELGNFIEDEGAIYLAHLIGHSKTLLSVNITHNHITQQGMQLIVDALEFNTSLLQLDYVQFGTAINEITLSEMRVRLDRNRRLARETRPDFDPDSVLIPEHVKEIYSVYRTR